MSRQSIIILCTILVIAAFVIFGLIAVEKHVKFTRQVTDALENSRFEEFHRLMSYGKAEKYLPAYNIALLNFESAVMEKDGKEADKLYEQLSKMGLSEDQAYSFYATAFGYYVQVNNKKKFTECRNQIRKLKGREKEKQKVDEIYHVVCSDPGKEIEVLLKKLPGLKDKDKIQCEYLIAILYQNIGRPEEAARYWDNVKTGLTA